MLSNPQMETHAPTDVPPDLRRLLEYLAERLNLTRGDCRLEVLFADGAVRQLFRHERVDAADIARL